MGPPAVQSHRHRADPVVGWRYWQVSPNRLLRSVTQKWIEWPRGHHQAGQQRGQAPTQ